MWKLFDGSELCKFSAILYTCSSSRGLIFDLGSSAELLIEAFIQVT